MGFKTQQLILGTGTAISCVREPHWVGYCLSHKHYARVERLISEKHASLHSL